MTKTVIVFRRCHRPGLLVAACLFFYLVKAPAPSAFAEIGNAAQRTISTRPGTIGGTPANERDDPTAITAVPWFDDCRCGPPSPQGNIQPATSPLSSPGEDPLLASTPLTPELRIKSIGGGNLSVALKSPTEGLVTLEHSSDAGPEAKWYPVETGDINEGAVTVEAPKDGGAMFFRARLIE